VAQWLLAVAAGAPVAAGSGGGAGGRAALGSGSALSLLAVAVALAHPWFHPVDHWRVGRLVTGCVSALYGVEPLQSIPQSLQSMGEEAWEIVEVSIDGIDSAYTRGDGANG
jgi:hypothetical protein